MPFCNNEMWENNESGTTIQYIVLAINIVLLLKKSKQLAFFFLEINVILFEKNKNKQINT